jgi:plasmid stabilization system protein ParE
MEYYIEEASDEISQQFWGELSRALIKVQKNPKRHHSKDASGLRRFNLKQFPYNFLYEDLIDRIRIQVVRHNQRNHRYGTRRKRG